MPNLAKVLKDEIRRISKSEAKIAADPLRKTIAELRTKLWALQRRGTELEKQVGALTKRAPAAVKAPQPSKERVTARTVKALRKRLGLSQSNLAAVLGVSSMTVYNWESGAVKPGSAGVAKIVAIKSLGKREVNEILAKAPAKKTPAKKAAAKKSPRKRAPAQPKTG
jgi:DNA-binding transcriptional regulator YiaG